MTVGFYLGALTARFNRFKRDKSGATAILFALAVLPLIFLIGLAVDFRTMQTARSDMQNAVDSAVLSAARVYNAKASLSETARQTLANTAGTAMFKANLKDAGPPLTTQAIVFTYDATSNKVTGTGQADCKTAFGGLMSVFGGTNISSVRIKVYGEAQGSDPRRLEIVLSLDNTGSMFAIGGSGQGRFNLMRSAAKNFVNTMFDQQSLPNKMYIGVIPWTTTVNINMEKPIQDDTYAAYAAPDVAFDGTREVPPAPFQDFKSYLTFPPGTTTALGGHSILISNPPDAAWSGFPAVAYDGTNAKHVAAFNALFAPVSWRGCIRGASTEGSTATNALTDSAPSPMRWPVDAVEPLLRTYSSGNAKDHLACNNSSSANDANNNAYIDLARPCRTTSSKSSDDGTTTPCVSDAYEFSWINSHSSPTSGRYCEFKVLSNLTPATPTSRTDYDNPWMSGPNVNCPSSMLGLSASREQILKTLNRMYPNSDGTQQEIGLMWGLRMLSPNSQWANFFGYGTDNTPKAYNTNDTRKILILLTDGDNNAPTKWEGYWGCTTTSDRNGGVGRSTDSPKLPTGPGKCWSHSNVSPTDANLDTLTTNYCNRIRSTYHIEIYTIGVDITAGSTAATLLRNCVVDDNHAKIISAAELDETFLSIANDTLRLVK